MSTKIWKAYALKLPRQLWPVCREIRLQAEKQVARALTSHYEILVKEAASRGADDEDFKEFRRADGSFSAMEASRMVRALYGKQLTSYEKDFYDLDVSVAIRSTGKRVLLIPYPGSGIFGKCLDFMGNMKELRDYHYQDQVDRNPGISTRDWTDRKKTWEPLLDDEWRHMLVLEIVSYNGWSNICPARKMELQKAIAAMRQVTPVAKKRKD